MTEPRDLLVEIGTEELPPVALRGLSEAFGREVAAALESRGLEHGPVDTFATPRRLAVRVHALAPAQPDRENLRRGPALKAAFDDEGRPTRAAEGFARSVGMEVERLERLETPDGAWLALRTLEVGASTQSLLPGLVAEALGRLPVSRRMRWADLEIEFVRPVHWVVLMYGDEAIDAELLGVRTGRATRGHRFHHPQALPLERPESYASVLESPGFVLADLDERRRRIRSQVEEAARGLGGRALIDERLLEEVTALVEWPVPVTGTFDAGYLELPRPVIVATLASHQRYFPVVDADDRLMPHFVTVSNIESLRPELVAAGNERVIRPRLADAAFFLREDLTTPLPARVQALDAVVYQEGLGSLRDKAERVSRLAGHVAIAMGLGAEEVRLARRAGLLGKCDLVTRMVGEFPELQGEIGGEYAARAGEPSAVATAIAEGYRPRYAGDAIPSSALGRALAVADRLDTLVGIFGIDRAPTGDRDPFALRRAALGALRILIEGELDLDLGKLVTDAAEGFESLPKERSTLAGEVVEFMHDRLRAYFAEQGIPAEVYAAVEARRPGRPLDFARRARAVEAFRHLPEADSLAAANKRIQNILRQASEEPPARVDEQRFREDAEWNLAAKLVGLGPRVRTLIRDGDYSTALGTLAGLRDTVDEFFDTVKVMDDDPAVRLNRLALLRQVGELFLETADISRLQG